MAGVSGEDTPVLGDDGRGGVCWALCWGREGKVEVKGETWDKVSLPASEKERGLLECTARVSDQSVFPHNVFPTFPGSLGLNESRLSLPATRRPVREGAGRLRMGGLPAIYHGARGGSQGHLQGQSAGLTFSSRHRAY